MSLRVPEVSLSVTKSPTTFCGIRVEDNMRVEASRFWKNHLRGSFYLEPSWHESERTPTTLIKRVESFSRFPKQSEMKQELTRSRRTVKSNQSVRPMLMETRRARRRSRTHRPTLGVATLPRTWKKKLFHFETRWKTIDKEADPTSTSNLLTKFFTSPTGILDFPFHLFLFTFSLSLAFPLDTLESSSQSQISF